MCLPVFSALGEGALRRAGGPRAEQHSVDGGRDDLDGEMFLRKKALGWMRLEGLRRRGRSPVTGEGQCDHRRESMTKMSGMEGWSTGQQYQRQVTTH